MAALRSYRKPSNCAVEPLASTGPTEHSAASTTTSAIGAEHARRYHETKLSTNALLLSSPQATTVRSVKSLIPLLDRVLVQRVKAEAKTASGIFLPESSVKDLNEAKVLAVGPGALDKDGKRLPMGVNAGDRVLIPQVR